MLCYCCDNVLCYCCRRFVMLLSVFNCSCCFVMFLFVLMLCNDVAVSVVVCAIAVF